MLGLPISCTAKMIILLLCCTYDTQYACTGDSKDVLAPNVHLSPVCSEIHCDDVPDHNMLYHVMHKNRINL